MRVLILAAALALFGLWYVNAPPRDDGSYREEAAETLSVVRSKVETDRIWIDTLAEAKATRNAAKVGFREMESGAAAAADEFLGYDPPVGSDDVRSVVSARSGRADEALAAVRIAAEQDRWEDVESLGAELAAASRDLERASRGLRP